jgi:hypothetical protein
MRIVITNTGYSIYKISKDQYARTLWHTVSSPFLSVTKTPDEISVIAKSGLFKAPLKEEAGWRMLYIKEQISFESIGILSSVLKPLASKKVSVLTVSTFNTDYVFFKGDCLDRVEAALKEIETFSL